MKRQLEKDELAMANKSLTNIQQEREWLEYQLEYYELMLKTGLEMNYKKNIRDFKQAKHEFEQQLDITKRKLSILQDQIRNGVEIKEDVKDEKGGDEQ